MNTVESNIVQRDKVIIKTSVIGIIANLFLSAFKIFVGVLSNSIAVILDAVNNLSDAMSSVVTIIGTKLASKKPNKKHPLGYGRIEYLSAMIVSAIVLYAGITSMVESVKKIINPEDVHYSNVTLIIIAVGIVIKLILGQYVKSVGKKVSSNALVASGEDAFFDAILSLSVFLSAVLYIFTGIAVEAYVGVLISVFIIKAGLEMMTDTLDDILGRRPDEEVTNKIKEILNQEDQVEGAYDLIINNYGPDKNYASVHLELPDVMTVEEVDVLTRRVQEKVYIQTGVILTGVGVYSLNTKDEEAVKIRNDIQKLVLSHEWALQLHGFYVDIPNKELRFDVVMSFDIEQSEGIGILLKEASEKYPEFNIRVTPDIDGYEL